MGKSRSISTYNTRISGLSIVLIMQSISTHSSASGTSIGNTPLTPTYIAPRPAPFPSAKKRQRIGRGLHTVDDLSSSTFKFDINSVFRKRKRAPSLKSSHSASTATSSETNDMAPIPVVSSHSSQDDGGECPVCLEPLSFSFRLPGEKPHIVPECGHALHEVQVHHLLSFTVPYFSFFPPKACFTAVYGPPPGRTLPQKSNLGVCGVCRRPMKVADGDGGKSNSALLSLFFGSVPGDIGPRAGCPHGYG